MEQKKRYAYLDSLKTAAIFCVCLYHFPWTAPQNYSDPLTVSLMAGRFLRGINSICVPLFLMVNGALLLNARFDARKHAGRTLRLAAGVYIWYLLTQFIVHGVQSGAGYLTEHARGIFYSALYLYEYDGVTLSHLWFVQMLAALYLLVPLIRAVMDSENREIQKGAVFCALVLFFFTFVVHDFEQVQSILPGLQHLDLSGIGLFQPMQGRYGAMLLYFVLGGLLHRNRDKIVQIRWMVLAAVFVCGAAGLFVEWLAVTKRTEMIYDIVYNGYNCVPTLMMAAAVFISAAKLNRETRLTRLVGRNTLAIYYLHWILGLTVLPAFSLPGSILLNIIKASALVIVCTLAGEGLRRVPVLRFLI